MTLFPKLSFKICMGRLRVLVLPAQKHTEVASAMHSVCSAVLIMKGHTSCFTAEGDLRLTGGGTSESGAQFGRLEVFSTGGWGTVCGSLPIPTRPFAPFDPVVFGAASADVACQQLGFQEGVRTATPVRSLSTHLVRVHRLHRLLRHLY